MRDLGQLVAGSAGGSAEQADTPPSLEEIRLFRARLGLDTADADDAARIERLHALEELRCVTEAAQCEVTADFTVSQRAAAAARGVRAERRDRGLGSQVALARRESPHRGNQDVALAMVLRTELPCTRAALRAAAGPTLSHPWCDAPIRHLDPIVPREADGPTTADNGQGLCEHCNHAKQAHGWASRSRPGPRHTVVTTTPTGHVYVSVAPAPAGTSSDDRQVTLVGYRSGPVLIAS